MIDLDVNLCLTTFGGGGGHVVWGQRSKIRSYSQAHNCEMATARTFKLFEDINHNVGIENINIMKGYPRAPDLESNVKNVKFQETS